MKYRELADTGVFVSELCLGTMTFGGRGQNRKRSAASISRAPTRSSSRARCRDQLRRHGERLRGRRVRDDARQGARQPAARGGARDESARAHGPGPNQVGLSRLHILQAVEASLKRLGTDYIDLYQIHRFDPLTNIEDTLRALDELVRAGKVRYIGCSNLAGVAGHEGVAISREQGLERFRCTQWCYSLAGHDLEREMIPLLKDQGLGLLVWSPLAGSFLSGKFTRDSGDEAARRAKFDFPPVNKEKGFDILDVAKEIDGPARRQRRADCVGLDSGEQRRHQRHHRRQKDGAARGRSQSHRR